jgi:hypothetical protein
MYFVTNLCLSFQTLSNLGILSAIEVILGLDDEVMKAAAIDIFSFIVEISPSMVREFILNEGQTQDDVSNDRPQNKANPNLLFICNNHTQTMPDLLGKVGSLVFVNQIF